MKKQILLILCAIALALTSYAQPAPSLIPFQGRLTDQAGSPAADGQYTLVFNLYNSAIGGTPLWTERHEQVGVINSTINVFLGSISPFADDQDIDFSETLYLGITIDADGNSITADPEMIPRQIIVPAFYAKNAEKLAGADWSNILVGASNDPSVAQIRASAIETDGISFDQIGTGAVRTDEIDTGAVQTDDIQDGTIEEVDLSVTLQNSLGLGLVPTGVIMPFAGEVASIPAGWTLCDGTLVNSKANSNQYQALYQVIGTKWGDGNDDNSDTFRLPDLRGAFLRGVDSGRGLDPDAASRTAAGNNGNTGDAVGSYQEDAFESHTHTYNTPRSGEITRESGNGDIRNSRENRITGATGGNETRPKNYYVHYIIKY